MTGADDMKSLFMAPPAEEQHRSHYGNLSARLTDETIAHVSSWCEQTTITTKNDAHGPIGKLIYRFGEHMVAQALAHSASDVLPIAARAGLLLTHSIGDNPRAQLDGANDRLLALVMEAALQLGTTFEALAPAGPSEVIHSLLEQTEASNLLDSGMVLVERWGMPLLAQVWNDERAAHRPAPFAPFEWWESQFPWDQVGPVTIQEPTPDELTGDSRARRLATEFARTGDVEVGLESVREAISCGQQDPAWMGLWVAKQKGGHEGVAAFNNTLIAAGLPAETNWRPPHGDRVDDTIVTDPWAGPFFDRLLTR